MADPISNQWAQNPIIGWTNTNPPQDQQVWTQNVESLDFDLWFDDIVTEQPKETAPQEVIPSPESDNVVSNDAPSENNFSLDFSQEETPTQDPIPDTIEPEQTDSQTEIAEDDDSFDDDDSSDDDDFSDDFDDISDDDLPSITTIEYEDDENEEKEEDWELMDSMSASESVASEPVMSTPEISMDVPEITPAPEVNPEPVASEPVMSTPEISMDLPDITPAPIPEMNPVPVTSEPVIPTPEISMDLPDITPAPVAEVNPAPVTSEPVMSTPEISMDTTSFQNPLNDPLQMNTQSTLGSNLNTTPTMPLETPTNTMFASPEPMQDPLQQGTYTPTNEAFTQTVQGLESQQGVGAGFVNQNMLNDPLSLETPQPAQMDLNQMVTKASTMEIPQNPQPVQMDPFSAMQNALSADNQQQNMMNNEQGVQMNIPQQIEQPTAPQTVAQPTVPQNTISLDQIGNLNFWTVPQTNTPVSMPTMPAQPSSWWSKIGVLLLILLLIPIAWFVFYQMRPDLFASFLEAFQTPTQPIENTDVMTGSTLEENKGENSIDSDNNLEKEEKSESWNEEHGSFEEGLDNKDTETEDLDTKTKTTKEQIKEIEDDFFWKDEEDSENEKENTEEENEDKDSEETDNKKDKAIKDLFNEEDEDEDFDGENSTPFIDDEEDDDEADAPSREEEKAVYEKELKSYLSKAKDFDKIGEEEDDEYITKYTMYIKTKVDALSSKLENEEDFDKEEYDTITKNIKKYLANIQKHINEESE